MSRATALRSLFLLWLGWLVLMFAQRELYILDWKECMNRTSGGAAQMPRLGEDGYLSLVAQAARNTPATVWSGWHTLYFYLPIIFPALLCIWSTPSQRERKLQVLLLALLFLAFLVLSRPPSGHHDCDRKGVGFSAFTLSLLGIFPAIALAFLARRL